MAPNDRLPVELDCSDLAREWPIWKRTFIMYMIANGKMEKSEKTKIATFLWLIGKRALEIHNTLFPNDGTTATLFGAEAAAQNAAAPDANDDDEAGENNDDEAGEEQEENGEGDEEPNEQPRTLDIVLKAFDDYCVPRKNTAMESFKFNTIVQKEKQTFSEFETELRTQLQYCDFKCKCGSSYEGRMLRDRIIIGVHDKKLQLKLLDGKKDPLKKVIETCKIYKALLDRRAMQAATVNAVGQHKNESNAAQVDAVDLKCYNCGAPFKRGHLRVCRANNITCNGCGKKGHFEQYCKQKGKETSQKEKPKDNKTEDKKGKQAHSLNWGDSGNCDCNSLDSAHIGKMISLLSSDRSFRINSNIIGSRKMKWTKSYRIFDDVIKFKIDTGSDVNCIPHKLINKFNISIDNEDHDFPAFDYSQNTNFW